MDHNKFLSFIQKKFPLVERPFLQIAEKFGLSENEVINLIKDLQEKKVIRQISAIFNPDYFGHTSGLFAFKVPEESLFKSIEVINNHPGVTHNYLRNHEYNLWFILVALPERNLLKEVKNLAELCGISDYLYLPAIKTFKISTVVDLENLGIENLELDSLFQKKKTKAFFSEFDKKMVKILQEPLPLVENPFEVIAGSLGITQRELFSWIKEMKKKGALRRFGALIKHDKVGYKINVMVGWEVEEKKIELLAKELIRYPFISHCYERKTYPHWRYNLYSMCHFKKEEEKKIISEIAKKYEIDNYIMLKTLKEFKKVRLKLFYDYTPVCFE